YQEYSTKVLVPLRRRLGGLLGEWSKPEYWQKLIETTGEPAPAPVQRIRVRVKQPSAVVRKVMAKPIQYSRGFCNDSFRSMTDAVGARVVVYFLSSLPLIDREIRECGWFDISPDKPPHAYMSEHTLRTLGLTMDCRTKASGYCSIHYVVRLRDKDEIAGEQPWFELQVRTLTQDLWAEIEHLLGYKYHTSSPMAQGQLQVIGRMLGTIDEYFDYMAGEMSHLRTQERLDESATLSAVNLPQLLANCGLPCSQYDIEGILKMAAACGLVTVGDLRELLISENIDRVTEAAQQVLGRHPRGSELVPALVLLGRMPNSERETILAQWAEFAKIFESEER
ncbi:MAG: hypothetical protein WBP29_07900, partial [Candidatus Zixiibacteriota bacterium]